MVFIIYPGGTNTTSVTQEADQKYGPFKTKFIENLHTFSNDIIIHNDYTTLQLCMVGIILFGGIGPESKVELKSKFKREFPKECNLVSWA